MVVALRKLKSVCMFLSIARLKPGFVSYCKEAPNDGEDDHGEDGEHRAVEASAIL